MHDRLIRAGVLGCLRVLSLLPLGGARRLGAAAGRLSCLLGTRMAAVTRRNLSLAFPELDADTRERLVASSMVETGRLAGESGAVWHWSLERCLALVERADGIEAIRKTQRTGKGVLVVAPHYGNWEIVNLYIGRHFGFTALYDPPRIVALDSLVRALRERSGSMLVPTRAAGLRALLKCLKGGGVVGLMPDQVPGRDGGVYAPFFSRDALTMTLAHRLLERTGAVPYVVYAERSTHGFRLRAEPMDASLGGRDELASVTAMNAHVERVARRHPEQYQWEYKRFKRPSPGAKRVY